jgi:hypothetical protein
MGEIYSSLLCDDYIEVVLINKELEYLLKEKIIWFCKKHERYLTGQSHVAINNTLNEVFGGY